MTTLDDLARVERELRGDASPHLGDGWSLHRKRQADTIAAFVQARKAEIALQTAADAASREREAADAVDAARWRAFKPMVRTFSLDMGGQHSYCTTGEFGRIRGPNIDAAMDAYILRLNAASSDKENTTKGSPNPEGLSDG